jgi:hypothetical protein
VHKWDAGPERTAGRWRGVFGGTVVDEHCVLGGGLREFDGEGRDVQALGAERRLKVPRDGGCAREDQRGGGKCQFRRGVRGRRDRGIRRRIFG